LYGFIIITACHNRIVLSEIPGGGARAIRAPGRTRVVFPHTELQ
jgi:hypothetical protein